MNQTSKSHLNLLRALGRYGCLSAPQLTRLLYGRSLKFVQGNLTELVERKLVKVSYLAQEPTRKPGGRDLRVYTLTGRGRSLVAKLGDAPIHTPKIREQTPLRHILAAHDLVILGHLLSRRDPTYQVTDFRIELDYRRGPIVFGETVFVPDGMARIQTDELEATILWEWDRATEGQVYFRAKIPLLASYAASEGLTVAFAAKESTRLRQMVRWTAQSLETAHMREGAEYLLFARFDPAEVDPCEVFTEPLWVSPFDDEPKALLA